MKWLDQNKWFVLAVLFLGVNAWGIFRLRPPPDGGETQVFASFEPGDGGLIESNTPVAWTFSQAMVPEEAAGQELADGPIVFQPSVSGRFRWTSSDRLEFAPQAEWPAGTLFTASWAPALKSLSGKAPAPPRTFAFQTPALQLLEARQVQFDEDRRVTLRLAFNAAVTPAALLQHLLIESPKGQALNVSPVGQTEGRILLVQTSPVGADHLILKLKKGLRGAAGPLPLESDVEQTVKCYDTMAITKIQGESEAFENSRISFNTSKPLDFSSAQPFIEVSPAVEFVVEPGPYSWNHECRLMGTFQPGRNYTVTFHEGLKSTDGSRLPTDQTLTAYCPDRNASVSFKNAGHYLSTRGNLLVALSSVNAQRIKVTAHRIQPNNLVQFAMRRLDNYNWFYGEPSSHLTRKVGTQDIQVDAKANAITETQVDLRTLLGNELSGAFHVEAEGSAGGGASHLVIVSDIGLSVHRSPHGLLVWVNSLHTLEPIRQARVQVYSRSNQSLGSAETDEQGLARIDLPADVGEDAFLLTASQGDDITYLDLQSTQVPYPATAGEQARVDQGYEAYVYTDRGIYRPGETVHARAILREHGQPGRLSCPAPLPVELRVVRPDGQVQRTLKAMTSPLGTTDFEFQWAEHDRMGRYQLLLATPGATQSVGATSLLLEEFVPPQIAVDINSPEGRAQPESGITFTVSARHLFGPKAAGSPVHGGVRFVPAEFTASNWPDYVFSDAEKSFQPVVQALGRQVLNQEGEATFSASILASWRPPSSLQAILEATVLESSGRAVSETATRWVDVYPVYLGLKMAGSEGARQTGVSQETAIVAVHPDGSLDTGPREIEWTLYSATWSSILRKDTDGLFTFHSERRLTPLQSERLTLKNGEARQAFTPGASGLQVLVVRDPASGASASMEFYVGSPDQAWMAWSMASPDRVELEWDKKSYLPGDTARLLIKAPFTGKALVTIESDRTLESRIVQLEKNTAEIPVLVLQEYAPNAHVSINLLRGLAPGESWATHRAVGRIPLVLDMSHLRLKTTLTSPEVVRPMSPLEVDITVTDAEGRGVPAEVTVAAVDEGICRLTRFKSPDPADFFSALRAPVVDLFDLYSLLLPELKKEVSGTPSATGGDGDQEALQRLNPIKARRFKPTALWATVQTGADGKARVSLDIPEFTGQLRLMAVSTARDAFGAATKNIVVRRPLVVRHSLPRFLAPGDECLLPVDLLNGTSEKGLATVAVTCQGPVVVTPAGAQSVELDKDATHSLSFQLKAADTAGRAVITISAELGTETFREEIELAVRPASARTQAGGSGAIAGGESAIVEWPGGWLEGTTEYRLTASALPSLEWAGGLEYLLEYPYGCLEQTVSASFPLLVLADLAAVIQPGVLTREQAAQRVQAGLLRVLSMQNASGGFQYWPEQSSLYEWGTLYATHFLLEAQKAGYEVPPERISAALGFIRQQLNKRVTDPGMFQDRPYACLVLALAGTPEHGWMSRLHEEPLYYGARVELAAAFAAAGLRRDASGVLSFLDPARAEQTRSTSGRLSSTARNLALWLSIQLDLDPENPDIPGLVDQLNRLRRQDHWGTTQDNAMVLLALGKYSRLLLSQQKGFTARALSNEGERPFTHQEPLQIKTNQAGRMELVNDGPGTAWFSWRVEGVPLNGALTAEHHGLSIQRRLLDLQGEPRQDGPLEQGELLVVEWSLELPQDVDNLVITDLLPAGLEVENTALATSQIIPWVRQKSTLPLRRVEVRDDRVLGFTERCGGLRRYYYAVRAVTPGVFVHPAIAAECMYDPDLWSRHEQSQIKVR